MTFLNALKPRAFRRDDDDTPPVMTTPEGEPLAIHGCVRVFALPGAIPAAMRPQNGMIRVTTSTELAEALNDLKPRQLLVPRNASITARELRIVANRFSVEHTVFVES